MAITMTMNFNIDPLTTIIRKTSTTSTSTATIADNNATMIVNEDTRISGCKRPLNETTTTTTTTEETEEPLTKKLRTQPKRKRVSFGPNSTRTVSRVEAIDAPYVWYSAAEFHHSRRCDAHWVNFYNHCDDSYKQELFQVLGAACGKLATAEAPLAALCDSACRGLEREMTPCFRQRKKQVVGNVLQSQSALLAYNKSSNTDKGAEVLAAHYRKLALPATRFARLLAHGDAILAAKER